jgi:GTP cyclohydrolase I
MHELDERRLHEHGLDDDTFDEDEAEAHGAESHGAWARSRDSLILEELGVAPSPRRLEPALVKRYEAHLAEILGALGLDLDTDSTRDTPRRFLAALVEATDGYEGDPKLVTAFPTECHGRSDCSLAQIIEGPIEFSSLCEHHALPFIGYAWLGYVAHDRILGISKLTRLVRLITRRFAVQERLTHSLADTIESLTQAHGVAVYLEARHLCTQMRGVREDSSLTRTTSWLGEYDDNAALRAEFLTACGLQR